MVQKRYIKAFALLSGVLFVVLVVLLAGSRILNRSQVGVVIEGPKQVLNGELQSYQISYSNNTGKVLSNVELHVNLPEGVVMEGTKSVPFVLERLGEISKKAKGQFKFNFAFFGSQNETLRLAAKLVYQPEGASSLFEMERSFEVTIVGSAASISFGEAKFDEAGRFLSELTLKNNAHNLVRNVTLKVVYPDNFQFVRANPPASSSNNVWKFEELGGDPPTTISLTGRILGSGSDLKPFHATLTSSVDGSDLLIAEASSINQIVSSGLVIFQTINKDRPLNVEWGSLLPYALVYKNNTTTSQENLVIEFTFNPSLVDLTRSNFGSGLVDSTSGSVRFDRAALRSLARLAPQEEGTVNFNLAVAAVPPQGASEHLTFKTIVSLKTSLGASGFDSPMGQDIIEMKIKTKVILASKIYYQSQYFGNVGPMPPKVGQKSTLAVVWEVSNFSNDVTSAIMESFLGPNVNFEGNVTPKNARISYNEELRKVLFDVGFLRAGTGLSRPIRQVVFQISLTPTQDQIGQLALLLGSTKFAGIDEFASSSISAATNPVYSNLPDDPTVAGHGTVVP